MDVIHIGRTVGALPVRMLRRTGLRNPQQLMNHGPMTLYEPDPDVRGRLESMLAVNDGLLQAALARARAQFNHAGNKGDEVEAATRDFLRSHLPRAYSVGHGEVIDRFGSRSSQLDALILSDAQPFVFPDEVAGVFLIEGVVGAGEVKSRLTTAELTDVLHKARRFRTLRGIPPTGTQAHSNPADVRRFLTSPPTFALAVETTISAEVTLERLAAAELVPSPDPLQSERVCCTDR